MQPYPAPRRLTYEQRVARMQQALRDLTWNGYRVAVHDGDRAIIVNGQPVNHVLHAILTIFTCGLWLLVWLLVIASGGEKRRAIHIDEYGNLRGLDGAPGMVKR